MIDAPSQEDLLDVLGCWAFYCHLFFIPSPYCLTSTFADPCCFTSLWAFRWVSYNRHKTKHIAIVSFCLSFFDPAKTLIRLFGHVLFFKFFFVR